VLPDADGDARGIQAMLVRAGARDAVDDRPALP
jgi:hypothetical protein